LKGSSQHELCAWEMLSSFGFNSTVVTEILANPEGNSGKTFFSATHRAVADRNNLIVQPIERKSEKSRRMISETRKNISWPVKLSFLILENLPGTLLPVEKRFASLDFEKLTFPLEIRKWKSGDSFQPFGMKGRKKVSDLLIDEKIPVPDKENVYLLCSSGKIAWVIGHRIDQRFRITARTTRIFRINLIPG